MDMGNVIARVERHTKELLANGAPHQQPLAQDLEALVEHINELRQLRVPTVDEVHKTVLDGNMVLMEENRDLKAKVDNLQGNFDKAGSPDWVPRSLLNAMNVTLDDWRMKAENLQGNLDNLLDVKHGLEDRIKAIETERDAALEHGADLEKQLEASKIPSTPLDVVSTEGETLADIKERLKGPSG